MSLPDSLREPIQAILRTEFGGNGVISTVERIGGGCIHNACRVISDSGSLFLKYNLKTALPMYKAELQGLEDLRAASSLHIPQPLGLGEAGNHAFFAMEFLSQAPRKSNFWEYFGEALAEMHRHSHENYGYSIPNFIGSLPQQNRYTSNWADFFAQERLLPQLFLAERKGLAPDSMREQIESLIEKLPSLMPFAPPSLLHGDLWSGNFMTGPDGQASIFDPAAYFGHREAEIAFTSLFGGYAPAFYDAYQATWPLEKGWQDRIDLFNLYPLMVHLNLFGRGYLPQVQGILSRYQ